MNKNKENTSYKPKVYDCFPFFNELDLLEIRLAELYNSVDYFVLCESTHTHSGKPKPLYYQENKKRYKKWGDKIIHLVYVPKSLGKDFHFFNWLSKFGFMKNKFFGRTYAIFGLGRWKMEHSQRNYLMKGLASAKDNDIIFISDADEIFNKNKIGEVKKILNENPKKVIRLKQKMYYYFFNGFAEEESWEAAKILNFGTLKKMKKPDWVRNWKFWEKLIGPLTKIRPALKREILLEEGGWHFSYIGGLEAVKNKIENSSHAENDSEDKKNKEHLLGRINEGKPPFYGEKIIKYIKINKDFPKVIQKNKKKYRYLIR